MLEARTAGSALSPAGDCPPGAAAERKKEEALLVLRLRKLVEEHFDFVWRSLRRLGVPNETADDAAQEVFWVMAKKLESVALGSERAFLFATALRTASDVRRRRERQRIVHDSELVEAVADLASDPDALLDQKRARDLLDVILDQLPFDLRTVLLLTEGEQLTMNEIADLLGVPLGTVASRLRRARALFQERVGTLLAEGTSRGDGT